MDLTKIVQAVANCCREGENIEVSVNAWLLLLQSASNEVLTALLQSENLLDLAEDLVRAEINRRMRVTHKEVLYQSAFETTTNIETQVEVTGVDQDKVSVNEVKPYFPYQISSVSTENIFERPYFIKTVKWTVTNNRFSTIGTLSLPNDFFSINAISPYGTMAFHKYIKMDFEITLRMNSSPFSQGLLLAVAMPYAGPIPMTPSSVELPHVFLRAGEEVTARFVVPYASYKPVIDPKLDWIGTLAIGVWSPLVVATNASTTVDVAIWVRPIAANVVLKRPAIYQADRVLHTLGLSKISQMIGSLGDITGLYDRPLMQDELPEDARPCDVPVHAQNLNFHFEDAIPDVSNRFSVKYSHDMLERMKHPTLVRAFQYSTANVEGDLLFNEKLHPMKCFPKGFSNTDGLGLDGVYATPLAYYSQFYQLWRGPLKVTFTIVANRMYQGQLYIAWSPDISGITASKVKNLPGASVSVGQACSRITVSIPFIRSKDFCNVRPRDEEDFLGSIVVMAQTPLYAPPTVASNVEILMDLSADDGYELINPCDPLVHGIYTDLHGKYQSSDEQREIVNDVKLIAEYKYTKGYYNNTKLDIRELLRRPEYGKWFVPVQADFEYSLTPFPESGIHGKLAATYLYYSGSNLFHIATGVTKNQQTVLSISYQQDKVGDRYWINSPNPYTVDTNYELFQGGLTVLNSHPLKNFLIPSYFTYPFRSAHQGTEFDQLRGCFTARIRRGLSTTQVALGHSVADDFELHYPTSLPNIAFSIAFSGLIPKFTGGTHEDWMIMASVDAGNAWKALNQLPDSWWSLSSTTQEPERNFQVCNMKTTFPVISGFTIIGDSVAAGALKVYGLTWSTSQQDFVKGALVGTYSEPSQWANSPYVAFTVPLLAAGGLQFDFTGVQYMGVYVIQMYSSIPYSN